MCSVSADDAQYGCFFCRTGYEALVATELEQAYTLLRATAVSQVKHRSINGVKSEYEQNMLPGYVFFETTEPYAEFLEKPVYGAIKCLKGIDGNWQLRGRDRQIAECIFAHSGVVEVSTAFSEAGKVRVTGGPLREFEGNIVKIDRRSRNGLVEFQFDQKVWKIWLAFDWIDAAQIAPPCTSGR